MNPKISSQTFYNRVHRIKHLWNNKYHEDLDSIIIINGKVTEKNQKTVAIVGWLLSAYNLADTIFFFSPEKIIIYLSQRKMKFFDEIKAHQNAQKFNLEFVDKVENPQQVFSTIWKNLHNKTVKPKVGLFNEDQKKGTVAQSFQNFMGTNSHEKIQISSFFNDCFVSKDQEQLINIKKSSLVTTFFFNKFIQEVQAEIDEGSHKIQTQICQKVVNLMGQEGQLKRCEVRVSNKSSELSINKQFIDFGPPIHLASGGIYAQNLFTPTLSNPLKSDCIILSLGCTYKSFNSYASRTLFINPSYQQKSMYKRTLNVLKIILQSLKPGIAFNQIYEKVANYMKEQMLQVKIPKSFGFGIGLFMKQDLSQITETNNRIVEQGSAFLVDCTFLNLKDQGSSKSYAIQLIQTVILPHSKDQEVLTGGISNSLNDISYELEDQNETKAKNKGKRKSIIIPNPDEGKRPLTRRGSKNQTLDKIENIKKREDHQKKLKRKKLEELQKRVNENFDLSFKKQKTIEFSQIQSFHSLQDFPKDIKKNEIYLDKKNNSILLPINNKHVPFHIYLLKNVARNDQGSISSLRFNFATPTTLAGTNLTLPKINQPTTFVKEIVFRSKDSKRFLGIQKDVKEFQKKVKADFQTKNSRQSLSSQENIKLNNAKKPRLMNLSMRPTIGIARKKKQKGVLECHLNGFRFITPNEQNVDITFTNVKHAIFQPCEKQIISVIHFRLHEPIIIGTKKSIDVQFYSEGGKTIQEIQKKNRQSYDDDSDDEEKMKEVRRKLDRQFQYWINNSKEYFKNTIEFQKPRRQEGFYGSFGKHNSFFQPTKNCLINVTESPFFISTLDEIEVVCLERIFQNNKTFDLIMVMKDYQTSLAVSSIPMDDVERIRDWIDKNDIIFYNQGKSLNWNKFLAGIRKSFANFVEDKAWMVWDEADEDMIQEDEEEDDSFVSQDLSEGQSSDSSDYTEQKSDGEVGEDLSEQGLSSEELEELAERQDRMRENSSIVSIDKRMKNKKNQKNKKK